MVTGEMPVRRVLRTSWIVFVVGLGLLGCKSSRKTPEEATASQPAAAAVVAAETASAANEYENASRRKVQEISLEVEALPEEREDFPEGFIRGLGLEKPDAEIARIRARDDIVIRKRKIVIIIDYPVAKPVEFPLESSNEKGFSRAELVRSISRTYHRMYEEEERSAKQKTVPPGERTGLINRNRTDGTYGIWGHDLGDLFLHTIEVLEGTDGITYVTLGIDS